MPIPWIAPAIGALGALGSSAMQSGMTKKAAKITAASNMKLAQYAYSKDLEMWNRANAYNDPSAQMARLKAAGLSPRLIYGSGAQSATGNTATTLPKYNAPRVDYKSMRAIDLTNAISQFINLHQKGAQIDLVNEQRRIAEANANYLESISGWKPVEYVNKMRGTVAENYLKRLQYEAAMQNAGYGGDSSSLPVTLASIPFTKKGKDYFTKAQEFEFRKQIASGLTAEEFSRTAGRRYLQELNRTQSEARTAFYNSMMKEIDYRWYNLAKGLGLVSKLPIRGYGFFGKVSKVNKALPRPVLTR